ncbi:MAG TPA: SLC13 family permease [Burkholderiales bacterium]|nr:SLC13 family permease [Burkholderiales bacterium]
MPRLTSIFTAVICIGAAVIFFLPPPQGSAANTMHAAALLVLTIGLWALSAVPEYVTALLFFLLAVVLAIAPPQVVFSAFTSATMWLVLGGLVIAEAVTTTGLGRRFAGVLFDRYTSSYAALIVAIALVATALTFFMPATIGRMLLLIPIVVALAERVGLAPGSSGYNGLCLTAIVITYQSGSAVLPANAPNLVLAGAAETLYGVPLIYGEFLWVMFPVLALLKGAAAVALVAWLYPAQLKAQTAPPRLAPMSAEERRLAVILMIALVLWMTDAIHGVRAGWVALAAGIACLLPRIGVLPAASFNDVRLGPFFYVGASIGLGAVVHESGLGELLGRLLLGTLDLQPDSDFINFMALGILNAMAGLVLTNPAQPAVMSALAGPFADAAGWSLNAALMTVAVGFNVMLLPYQVPPVVVGMHAAGLSMRAALRFILPLAVLGILVFLPLDYLWWRMIGYFH